MTFSNKISKLGNGKNINCLAKSNGSFDIYFFNQDCVKKKTFNTENNIATLSTDEFFEMNEVVPLSSNFKIGRIDSNIFLIKN